jgi:cell wall assembly regulator SMI1
MSEIGISERWEQFVARLGIPDGAPWLKPPVAASQLASTEAAVGFELPADLRALLEIHNGGRLFDGDDWAGCSVPPAPGLASVTERFRAFVASDLLPEGQLERVPSPRTLHLTGTAQVGLLYDLDSDPGRLLYLDVLARPAVIPLCRDLATLMDCYISLAEAGLYTVEPQGPFVTGPPDAVREIYLRSRVAAAPIYGIEAWVAWPGSSDFEI